MYMYEESKYDIFKTIECIFLQFTICICSHFAIVLIMTNQIAEFSQFSSLEFYWFKLMGQLSIEEDNN